MKLSLLLASCMSLATAVSGQQSGANSTIFDVAAGNANLSSLAALLKTAGLEAVPELLRSAGPFTLFAPNNAALSAAKLNTSDAGYLINVLKYHVIRTAVNSSALSSLQFPDTLLTDERLVELDNDAAQKLAVSKSSSGDVEVAFGLEKAKVVTADVTASNGVIHIVDKLLLPPKTPSATAIAANFTKLVDLLTKARMTESINEEDSVTIFVPTNEAFEKFGSAAANMTEDQLEDLLEFHIAESVIFSNQIKDGASVETEADGRLFFSVKGDVVSVNGAKIIKTDILTSNGVIHVIDSVLTPTQVANSTGSAANGEIHLSGAAGLSAYSASFAIKVFAGLLFVTAYMF